MRSPSKSLIVFHTARKGDVAMCCHATTSDPFQVFPALFELFRDRAPKAAAERSAGEWAELLRTAVPQVEHCSAQMPQESARDASFTSIFVVGMAKPEPEFSWFQRLSSRAEKPSGLGPLLGVAEDQPLLASVRQEAHFTLAETESPVSKKELARKMQLAKVFRMDTLLTGVVFAIVGGAIGIGVPLMLRAVGEDGPYIIGIRLFGGLFLALGLFFFGLGLLPLFTTNPWNRKVLRWWGTVLGAMAGAASFAILATAQLPCWVFLNFVRKDLTEELYEVFAEWSFVQPLSFALGLLTFAGMYFIGRSLLRKRPRFVS